MSSFINTKNSGLTGLTFDDVLLLPGFTDFSRSEVDLSVQLHKNLTLKIPVISSPMDTVTESAMAMAMANNGGIGVLHRSLTPEDQIIKLKAVKSFGPTGENPALDSKGRLLCGAAVGAGSDLEERVKLLIENEVDLIVIDSGNGWSKFIIDALKYIKTQTSTIPVMAGNITSFDGATALIDAGADILRVGMGPGSICTTRIVTGVGVPQLTAVSEAKRAVIESGKDVKVIADGGIKQIGDIAKAIAFGSDAVMLGSLLAGFNECPGDIVEVEGKMFKLYRGMGSVAAMKKGGAARYGQNSGAIEKKLVAEGVEGLVAFKGSVDDFIFQIQGGVRSSCYNIGGKTLKEFQDKVKYVQITAASYGESMPHGVNITSGGASFLRK
jgi:IMP dehydrogenase